MCPEAFRLPHAGNTLPLQGFMIELEYNISLPRDATWNFLTQNAHLVNWWDKSATLEPIKTGKFNEVFDTGHGKMCEVSGLVTAFEAPHRLQMNYARSDWQVATRLEFLLTPTDTGTHLYLQHSGWEAFKDEAARSSLVDTYVAHWHRTMDRFARYCAETL